MKIYNNGIEHIKGNTENKKYYLKENLHIK